MRLNLLILLMLCMFSILICQKVSDAPVNNTIPAYLLAENSSQVQDYESDKIIAKQSYKMGMEAGSSMHDPTGFFLTGLAGGTVLGLIGAIGSYNLAKHHKPKLKSTPELYDQAEYNKGYRKQSISLNKKGALLGSVTGCAINTLIWVKIIHDATNSIHVIIY